MGGSATTAGYITFEKCDISRQLQITGFYTSFEERFSPDYYFDGECHDFWEMVYVLEGTAGVAAGQMVYSLTAGQMILHPPMEFHRIWAADGTAPRVIVLSFAARGLNWDKSGVRRFSSGQMAQMRRLQELLKDSFQIDGIVVSRILPNRERGAEEAACILEYLLLDVLHENSPSESCDESMAAQRFRRLVSILEENLEGSLNMTELTAASGMSESSIKRIFARYTGMSPMRYYMDMKVRRAIALLAEGYRVGAVSERLGFENQNYFCTAFKRVTGSAPSQFRKLQD